MYIIAITTTDIMNYNWKKRDRNSEVTFQFKYRVVVCVKRA
jgi:hypothetical protein